MLLLWDVAGSKKEGLAPPQQPANSKQLSQAQQLGPDLSNLSPKLQQEWDKEKNAHLGIAVIAKKSDIFVAWRCNRCPDYRASWTCVVCGGSWEAVLRKRALHGTGCPDCYALRRGHKADGSRTSHPTFRAESGDHPLMSEWDKDANEEDGLCPDKIKLRSHKHVNWVCHKCPMGHLHLYKAQPYSRTEAGTGCPYCAGQKVCKFRANLVSWAC